MFDKLITYVETKYGFTPETIRYIRRTKRVWAKSRVTKDYITQTTGLVEFPVQEFYDWLTKENN